MSHFNVDWKYLIFGEFTKKAPLNILPPMEAPTVQLHSKKFPLEKTQLAKQFLRIRQMRNTKWVGKAETHSHCQFTVNK